MGNIVNNVALVNSGRIIDGPRINQNMLGPSLKDKLKTTDSVEDKNNDDVIVKE